MSVDYFTFAAQMVNFAILVWLLNKVLYGPILSAIQARENNYKERQERIDSLQSACEELKSELESEKQVFENRVADLHREALAEVESLKRTELGKARGEVQLLERRWREGLREQQEAFSLELRRRTATAVMQIAGRVLRDLTGEERVQALSVQRFLETCEELELEGPVSVRSARPLLDPQREALLERFPEASFELEPDLLLGLELVHQGRRIGWSAEAHLEAMGTELETILREASVGEAV